MSQFLAPGSVVRRVQTRPSTEAYETLRWSSIVFGDGCLQRREETYSVCSIIHVFLVRMQLVSLSKLSGRVEESES